MKKAILLLSLLTATLFELRAATIFSDSFNYPDGSIVDSSDGIWINNTGGGTGNLMLVTNQQLIVSASRTEDIATRFPSSFTTNGPTTNLYSSFTLKCTGSPTIAGAYFAHFSGTNAFGTLSGFRARVWASLTNITTGTTNSPGQFTLAIANSGLSGNTNASPWLTPLSTNVTYTIVTRYNLATGLATLWINPADETDLSVSGTDTIPLADYGSNGLKTNGPVDISHFGFRQTTGEGTMVIDNFRAATRFNDIAGTNTSPSISPIANRSTAASTSTGPIAFTISDVETTDPSLLQVTATSSNPALVPNDVSHLLLSGTTGDRTITVTPTANQQGSTLITVFVSDGVNTSSSQFVLTVGAPIVSPIANQITSVNQPVTVPFTVSDTENDALTITTNSSNTALVPNGNISLSGSGANRSITLTPTSGLTGNSTITISVSDGANTTQTSFVLTVKGLIGLVFADEFNYPDGPLFNLSDVWIHASSGAGVSGEMQVTNGAVIVNNALTEDVLANLTNGPFASSTGLVLYCSFTLSNSALPSLNGSYFMHYRDSAAGSTFKCKVFASTTNAAPGTFRLGIANSANAIASTSQFPLNIASNGVCTVVTRYNIGTGESRLWVNPNSENDTSVAAADGASPSQIGAIALREDSSGGASGIEVIDNIKIGTSYSDVLTVTNVVIPALSASLSGGNVLISWPTNATGFNLESTPNLNAPITWGSAGSPTQTGTNNVVTITSPTGNQFFRLRK